MNDGDWLAVVCPGCGDEFYVPPHGAWRCCELWWTRDPRLLRAMSTWQTVMVWEDGEWVEARGERKGW